MDEKTYKIEGKDINFTRSEIYNMVNQMDYDDLFWLVKEISILYVVYVNSILYWYKGSSVSVNVSNVNPSLVKWAIDVVL